MLPKVVCGGWCVFSLSKKRSCSPLPAFRSWNCLFFLFEVETLETSPFRVQKKEKEKKKSSGLPLAWRLFACLLLTSLPICSLHRNPGQPGLCSGSRTTNSQTIQKKNSLALKEAPKICLGLLVFEPLMNAEEKMHLLILHPVAHLPLRPPLFLLTLSALKHTPRQSCPLGFSAFAGATPSPGIFLPHPGLVKSSWSYPVPLSALSSAGKESTCNEGDLGSIPGLGRSPGKGKGYPLQYSGLENSMDCIVHGVTKSQT